MVAFTGGVQITNVASGGFLEKWKRKHAGAGADVSCSCCYCPPAPPHPPAVCRVHSRDAGWRPQRQCGPRAVVAGLAGMRGAASARGGDVVNGASVHSPLPTPTCP